MTGHAPPPRHLPILAFVAVALSLAGCTVDRSGLRPSRQPRIDASGAGDGGQARDASSADARGFDGMAAADSAPADATAVDGMPTRDATRPQDAGPADAGRRDADASGPADASSPDAAGDAGGSGDSAMPECTVAGDCPPCGPSQCAGCGIMSCVAACEDGCACACR